MPLFELIATALGLAGSYLLYLSWKRHTGKIAALAWACLLATFPLWILAQGPEFGVIYGLCLPAFFVWIGIYAEQKRQNTHKRLLKPSTEWRWNGKKVIANIGLTLYMLPLLMIISSLVTTCFVYLLPISEPNQMATGIIILPMLWGSLAYWYQVSPAKYLPLTVSFTSAVASGIYLFG